MRVEAEDLDFGEFTEKSSDGKVSVMDVMGMTPNDFVDFLGNIKDSNKYELVNEVNSLDTNDVRKAMIFGFLLGTFGDTKIDWLMDKVKNYGQQLKDTDLDKRKDELGY